jgi:prophage regulatory protein
MPNVEIASLTTNDSSEQLTPKPGVLKQTTFSDTTLWRRVRAGDFPALVRNSPGSVAWRQSEIDAWVRSRSEGR